MADTDRPLLDKGDEVVAAVAMRDVPEGTEGKVVLVTGLTWIRYWVRFENGIAIGSINRKALMTPREWDRRHDVMAEVEGAGGTVDDAGEEVVAEGGGVAVNGVLVPQKLIDRTKAARARLGA